MKPIIYLDLKKRLIECGYANEIDWQDSIKECIFADDFARETIFVICNSGMKAQIAQKIFDKVMKEIIKGFKAYTVFKHYGKSQAISDDHKSYSCLGLSGYSHFVVNHSRKEYVRGNVHTNGIESFWALLKRGYHGTFHHYSHKHALRYINEFVARNNNKGCNTLDVLAITVKNSNGKFLPYKELIRGC